MPTSVIDCSANTTISISENTTCVGGLVGGSRESSTDPVPSSFTIKNCTTTGTIIGGFQSVGSITGHAYNSTVENCTSTMTWNSGILEQIGISETI
ncbi:GLUG motif-containing protein [Clostridium sp.]|uniref:GLUG motif-containing protein n=1 Tax=Clostridium sp. TaxID=1506 RepID=UPI002FDEB109